MATAPRKPRLCAWPRSLRAGWRRRWVADAAYGSLPFAEQIAFFRRKLNLPTEGWTDIYTAEHDWAFVVAGANRDAIVSDFRAAVEKAIAEGTTLQDFRKDFDAIVATHGWDYNGGRDWRSRVIYETNLNTSYAAGRFEQLQAAPLWQYVHADWVQNPRHQHLAWDGLVLPKDDPWWQAHFPPNGWGCQCSVRGLWPDDLAEVGKQGPDAAPEVNLVERLVGARSATPRLVRVPEGIDPGFEYTPGSRRQREEARQAMQTAAAPALAVKDASRLPTPMRAFAEEARTSKVDRRLDSGSASRADVEFVLASLGRDVSGFPRVLEASSIRHAFKSHGDASSEVGRGQIAVTEEDFDLLLRIASEGVKSVGDRPHRGSPTMVTELVIGDVRYYVVDAIRKHDIAMVTLRKHKVSRPKKNPRGEPE